MKQKSLLKLEQVSKYFPGVMALDHVDLEVFSGEVHVLMGENGAGKSTLMKIVDGIYKPDEGEIYLYEQSVKIQSPIDAIKRGIAMIHQELNPVPEMTVAENIFLGREFGSGVFLSRHQMNENAEKLMQRIGIHISPQTKMKELTVAQMQMVEIAKAVSLNARILIMDEPTSAISEREVEVLFQLIRRFKENGVGVIYISHKMDEIFQIADRITVMRDGKTIGTYNAAELNTDSLIALMVGRELTNIYPEKKEIAYGEVLLEVENLCSKNCFENISLKVRRGEILGIAGLMGAGRSETAETLFGIRKKTKGTVKICGTEREIRHPKDAIRAGVALVTENRKRTGLNLKSTVKKDMSILTLDQYCKWGQFLIPSKEKKAVMEQIHKLKIKTPSIDQKIKNLSGGNQQKVILARWLLKNPDILILDEPTRGIDVGAKYEIYTMIQDIAAAGKAVIMISSEMPEIIGVCDRVVVMHEGKITGCLEKNEMTQEKIMQLAAGMEGKPDDDSKKL